MAEWSVERGRGPGASAGNLCNGRFSALLIYFAKPKNIHEMFGRKALSWQNKYCKNFLKNFQQQKEG
jgi:hypothetical protein